MVILEEGGEAYQDLQMLLSNRQNPHWLLNRIHQDGGIHLHSCAL